jgi:RNA polymerase sigma-70 factor (ECF subfamily)
VPLIRAAQAGDRLAFEELVSLFDRPVLRLVRSVVRSAGDAEDLYQETFLKAYRALPRFRFECSFYTWIYRIATNTCLDYLRRHAVQRPVETALTGLDGDLQMAEDLLPDRHPMANPEQLLLSREVEQRIGAALQQLNPRERMVFELKHYQGLRLTTIGAILDTSEATARNALFRATQKLRVALADLITGRAWK